MQARNFVKLSCLSLLLCVPMCRNATQPTVKTGTLQFDLIIGNPSGAAKKTATAATCKILDVKTIVYKIEVAKGDVVSGQPDNLDWKTIYTSTVEMGAAQRQFDPVELPVGSYQAIKFTLRNGSYWVCETPAGDTVELADQNQGGIPFDSLSPINAFGTNGLCYISSGNFTMQAPGEKMGGFEIRDGVTTKLTLIENFNTLDWTDTDGNGEWSAGDVLGNRSLLPGKSTMVDFVVAY